MRFVAVTEVEPGRGNRGTTLTPTGSGSSPAGKTPELKALLDGGSRAA